MTANQERYRKNGASRIPVPKAAAVLTASDLKF